METTTRPHCKKTTDGRYAVLLDKQQIGPAVERAIDISIIILWLTGGGLQDMMDYHDKLLDKCWSGLNGK